MSSISGNYQDFNPNFELEINQPSQAQGNFKNAQVYHEVLKGTALEEEAKKIQIIGLVLFGVSCVLSAFIQVSPFLGLTAFPIFITSIVLSVVSVVKAAQAQEVFKKAKIANGEVPYAPIRY